MENQPLVSILINNYNYGRFLKDAIDSALNQTYPRIEVIVVDDGSTDNSREIIASYGDRIKPVLKKNGGQASAFNAGFAASRGEIICFLDADDLFKAEKVAAVVKDLQRSREVGWHFHSLELFGSHGEKNGQLTNTGSTDLSEIYDLRPYLKRGKLKGSLSFELNTATSGTCFRRWLLEKILPMSEEIRITSDDYIKYAALGISKGFISFQSLAQQRIHENNAYTFKPNIEKIRATTQVLTARSLREKFPELSKFSNNLVAMGLSMYWWIEGSDAALQNLIKIYLETATFSEKVGIYTKAAYHNLKHYSLSISGFK